LLKPVHHDQEVPPGEVQRTGFGHKRASQEISCSPPTGSGVSDVETIVVDGGSSDSTIRIAEGMASRVLMVRGGRAAQMNAGARVASGDVLVFLHGDTVLPRGWLDAIRRVLSRPDVVCGAFELRLDDELPGSRIVERLANFRSRRLGMPYGDQALFVRADSFTKVGGFPDQPIMEDFEFLRRIKRIGHVRIADSGVVTSARRWRELGVLRTTLVNQAVIVGYYVGLSPGFLRRLYKAGTGWLEPQPNSAGDSARPQPDRWRH
jgi:rSAM/selenodomain-associated transferase 2